MKIATHMYNEDSAARNRKIPSVIRFIEPLPADVAWWRHAAAECLRQEHRLHPREREFVAGMVEWDGRPSPRQVDWVIVLHARLYPVPDAPSIIPDADSVPEWQSMTAECYARQRELVGRERQFVAALVEWRTTPSQKQLAWLGAIHARLHHVRATA